MSVALASIFIAVSGHENFLGDIQLKEMKEKINNEPTSFESETNTGC